MENFLNTAHTQTEKERNKEQKKRRRETRRGELDLPSYTAGEEAANAISHGAGAILSIFALFLLLKSAPDDFVSRFSVLVYGISLFALYTVSTLYHALGVCGAKKVFRILDHCTIYLLIAGTYTPITLLCLTGRTGLILFAVVWTAAIVGIVLNAVDMKRFRKVSMACYLAMGWSVVFAFGPLMKAMKPQDVFLLLLGGVLYTVGAVIYGKGRSVRYMHSLWHLFVLGGSISHFFLVYHLALA
ncbi:putative membrane hydrolase [Ruminococcaceae bacterium BL-6]|nr:putative membrane hydrolase [Ruminococcaceae bacterium BL-6]